MKSLQTNKSIPLSDTKLLEPEILGTMYTESTFKTSLKHQKIQTMSQTIIATTLIIRVFADL